VPSLVPSSSSKSGQLLERPLSVADLPAPLGHRLLQRRLGLLEKEELRHQWLKRLGECTGDGRVRMRGTHHARGHECLGFRDQLIPRFSDPCSRRQKAPAASPPRSKRGSATMVKRVR
jgi:hypothetical protein